MQASTSLATRSVAGQRIPEQPEGQGPASSRRPRSLQRQVEIGAGRWRGDKVGSTNSGKARLPEQPAQVLAPVTHVEDLNTFSHGPVDDNEARSGYHEAPVLRAKLRPSDPNSGVVPKVNALLFQPVDETKGAGRAVLSDVIVDALKVGKSFEGKDAAAHPTWLVVAALRRLNSSNTSPAGTT